MKKITTVILAAGKSSRFKSSKSKVFQELGGLSIIEHVYSIAELISKDDVVFVCNKDNINQLKIKFSKAKFALQKNQSGTADAILSAKKYLNNVNMLILFGDVPLISLKSIKRLIKNFYNNNSVGSMIAFKASNPHGYGRVITKNDFIYNIVEQLHTSKEQKKINLCNSGVMLCSSKLLFNNINKISNKNLKKEKYLPDIFLIFYKNKTSFNYILASEEEMMGINTIENLITLDKIYQNKLVKKIISRGVMIQQPETVRLSFDTKIKKGSLIESFVSINPGVVIKEKVHIKSHTVLEGCSIDNNSSVGPFARIRPHTKIGQNVKIGNYVEIKNSKIGNNTSISHLSYIGDSTLGRNVNIGAGTITCNYNGKKKNRTIIGDNVFIGSNSSLVAPIVIEKNSTIGAGSVITENIPSNHLAIERSEIKILRKPRKK